MNQVHQGESSGGPSGLPQKRRRGRPRKNPSLRQAQASQPPPGFEGVREPHASRVNTVGTDHMVGQVVTGVIEATFEAGYLLSVRIGNSSNSFRGVVFKPGQCVPVTAENDVAPHLQMIRRNNVQLPTENQGRTVQTPSKRRYVTHKSVPSVPPVGIRGNVVPVILTPPGPPNGQPISNQIGSSASQSGHVLDFGDKSVHMVEPISMLPPDRSIPVGQIFVTTQAQRVNEGTKQNANGSFNINTFEVGQGNKMNPVTPTETDTSGSSETSESKSEDGGDAVKPPEDVGIVSNQGTGSTNQPFSVDSFQTASVTAAPLFGYGAGRMTELLQVR